MADGWLFSATHRSHCKVLDEQTLWGQAVCHVWLPDRDVIMQVPQSSLRPLDDKPPLADAEAARITYVAAAAKIAEILEGSSPDSGERVLLAPMESSVIPLPHQLHTLKKAISGDRIRYLLADEVGLGKTIEAGLIMRELKLRGRVLRTLVVAPKGVATQWVAEMHAHFNEPFQLVQGSDIGALHRLAATAPDAASGWSMFDQVVVSQDSVKPVDKRKGWSADRVAAYNRQRFEGLITADWDLVIVDEAHRLGGSTDRVARHRLGKGLAEAAPYVLFLSATPHQGKSDAFQRLMGLLDKDAFPDESSISRERVAPYVLRTEKRMAIDANGQPLFKPRRTELAQVAWKERHHLQQVLYESVTEYVRVGYNQAIRDQKRHIGFLMVLMQRLVTSSTHAIRATLEKRLAVLESATHASRLALFDSNQASANAEALFVAEDWEDLDGQAQLEALQDIHAAYENEVSEVRALLNNAVRCEEAGPDAKAEALIEWLYKLQAEENDVDLKLLLFTEFVPTQNMLCEFLQARGISVVSLNGSMSMAERKVAQDAFRDTHRVLISTDAGGEGLNLQFAHVVINYDIPWNPMRLEQRIGRVDRIGQPHPVRAVNLVFEESVEFRVREVLEQKLAVILDEFGIDKTGDVLDSAQAGELFEGMFASALLEPDHAEAAVDDTLAQVRKEIVQSRASSSLFGRSAELDASGAQRLRTHPLPHWVERMTLGYIRSQGGTAERKRSWWNLVWPDGEPQQKCVFSSMDAARLTDAQLLNLENERIRRLTKNLPLTVPGQAITSAIVQGLPAEVSGYWGLFEIRLRAGGHETAQLLRIPRERRGYVSVFVNEQGKTFLPTARHIWNALLTTDPEIRTCLNGQTAMQAHSDLHTAAEQAGQDVFSGLYHDHLDAIAREEERGQTAFAARRNAIAMVGLPEVRAHRMSKCDVDETDWRHELGLAREVVPDLRPVLLLHIAPGPTQ